MTNNGIYSIAKEYLLLGIIGVLFTGILFLAGYYFIYRKMFKGTKVPKGKRMFWSAVGICYLTVVLGATLLDRGGYYGNSVQLHLFASYRQAWYRGSVIEWRNLILNILLFVPMGIILPMISEWFRSTWKTYLTGFIFSSLIEVIQFITARGIVEIDDIWNNTLGTMIGYGLVKAVILFKNKEESRRLIKGVCLQIPLMVAILVFCSLCIIYDRQEFGNLWITYSVPANLKKAEIEAGRMFSQEENTVWVYRTKKGTVEDTRDTAEKRFRLLGTEVDDSRNSIYTETAVYTSEDGNYSLWIGYGGMTEDFTDFSQLEEKQQTGYTEKEVRSVLKKYQMEIPEIADFSEKTGVYSFQVSMEEIEEGYVNGTLQCRISKSGKIISYENNMISCSKVKECEVLSEHEAARRISKGKFQYWNNTEEITYLKLKDASLEYVLDSKGFYQPVYKFETEINKTEETQIMIPALQS